MHYCAECKKLNIRDRKNEKMYCEKSSKYINANNDACDSFALDLNRSYSEEKEAKRYCYVRQEIGCYITTLVVNILGYKDKCEVMMNLRKLRTDFMAIRPEYTSLLVEYDALGPIISKKIINMPSEERTNLARTIYNVYLKYVNNCVKLGKYEEAVDFYAEMFGLLKKQVFTDYIVPETIYPSIDLSKSMHGRLEFKPILHK